jgi:hypothetical protein
MIVGAYLGKLEDRIRAARQRRSSGVSAGRKVASGDCYRFRLHDRRR